jgi:hypothetical protein
MKVTRLGRTGIVAAVAAAALAAGGVGIASAAGSSGSTPTDLTTAKQKADKHFDAAQQRLTKLKTRVDGAQALTGAHKSLLDSEISALSGRVTSAKAIADAATSLDALKADLKADKPLLAQGRVLVEQARQLGVADKIIGAADMQSGRAAKLQARIDALPDGSTKADAQAAYNDLKSKLDDAVSKAKAVAASDEKLDITDTSAAQATLSHNRSTAVAGVKADRKAVKSDIQRLRKDLKGSAH